MAALQPSPHLDKASIRKLCGARVFERGQNLAAGHELAGLVRAGDEVFGRCAGSMGQVYELRITLENGIVGEAICSCAFEGSGLCKHLVGLLLRLDAAPSDFETLPPLRLLLSEFSSDELVTLAETLVRRAPMLLPVVTLGHAARRGAKSSGKGAKKRVDEAMRPSLRRALSGLTANDGAFALESALREAGELEAAGDWAQSGAVYATVLEELTRAAPRFEKIWQDRETEGYESDGDDSGASWAEKAFEGLRRGLETPGLAPELREAWTALLWKIWQQTAKMDTFSLPSQAREVLAQHASSAVWKEIEAQLRAGLRSVQPRNRADSMRISFGRGPAYEEPEVGWFENYLRAGALEWLILGWKARGRGEEVPDLLLQWGTTPQKFEILMARRDFEAAEKCARDGFGGSESVLTCAETLEAAGETERAARLGQSALDAESARARSFQTLSWAGRAATLSPALEWMTRFATRHERIEVAQSLAAQLFARRPDAESLQLWQAATALRGDWNASYAKREAELPNGASRLHLAICDGRAERALELFHQLPKKQQGPFTLAVAELCEADFPEWAAAIYQSAGEAFIAARGESNPRVVYREAAQAWLSARKLHQKMGTLPAWNEYLSAQRAQNSKLRALLDELKKAGL